MEYKYEIKPVLVLTTGETTQVFKEGDAVMCRTENGGKYIGKIATIGRYQESEEVEPENVICIHTFKDKTSYSGEIIKAADIEYMCKCPLGDLLEYPRIDEKIDRDNFIKMLVGLGHDEPKAKNIYESMKQLKDLYNIPLSSMLASVIQEVDLGVDGDKQVDIGSMFMDVMIQVFQTTTEVIRKSVEACAGE